MITLNNVRKILENVFGEVSEEQTRKVFAELVEPIVWNCLEDDDRRSIARAAGYSESESALLAKIRWEGFPKQILNQLLAADWKAATAEARKK